ncbi:MAG TPA: restriction endonuclease subunit S [Rickettsiales bacterium]|nr:restriction endonuclease subunit S [Rickettsiales bacterium]
MVSKQAWRKVFIKNVAQVFDGPHATPKTVSEGPVFLGINSLDNGRLNLANTRHVTEEDYLLWTRRVTPQANDIVFSYETRIGEAAIIPEGLKCCLGRRMGLVRVDSNQLDPRFFLYSYLSPQYQEFLRSKKIHGSTVERLALTEFPNFPLAIPDISEQREIINILSCLDNKIELNQQMNKTLEAIARTLFKSWFIDFDPVKARAEGRKPNGMDDATATLFPSRFVESELGMIPEGWSTAPFASLIQLIGGGTPKTTIAEYWNGTVPWFSVVDAPVEGDVFVIATEKNITETGLKNSSARLLPIGTTIISARGTVGRIALVGVPMAMNQSCYGIRGLDGIGDAFTYFATKSILSELKIRAHGSVFDTITRETFGSVLAIKPSLDSINIFEQQVASLFKRILSNLQATRNLMAIRDLLLPRLISGKLRIETQNDIESVA